MISIAIRILKIRFIKFGIVGFLGTITNLGFFFVLVDILKFNASLISAAVFLIAGAQNYTLNQIWTFRDVTGTRLSFKAFAKFILVAIVGLGANLLVLNLLLHFFVLPYQVIAQGIGILAGMLVNFAGSKYLVFVRREKRSYPESRWVGQNAEATVGGDKAPDALREADEQRKA